MSTVNEKWGKELQFKKASVKFQGACKAPVEALKNRFQSHIPRDEVSLWPGLCISPPVFKRLIHLLIYMLSTYNMHARVLDAGDTAGKKKEKKKKTLKTPAILEGGDR